MCGILAILNTNKTKDLLDESLDLMDHRGPDSTGSILHLGNYFGHKRLAIIDLDARSNQPLSIDDYLIIYNGEIYNYKELIVEHGLKVNTTSDTEVVLLMYIKYREKCLQYFNGMFAFVIYNTKSKETFVARDRLGIKPLYYRTDLGDISFASEISSLLKLQNSPFDDFGVRQYKKLRMTLKGYTLYDKIKMFPPGSYYFNGTFHKYWEYEIPEHREVNDEELEDLIKSSVYLRKRSDVSVGSFLSGGLDSTILTYLLKPDYTWTVGFKELNEFSWSRLAAESLDSIHTEIIMDKELFLDTVKYMIENRKEPLSVPNEVLIYLMSVELKMKNTVVLSGEGADELFWGYYKIFKWANKAKNLNVSDFNEKYCYGSHEDNEVIDFALEGIPYNNPLKKIAYFFQIYHLHGLLRRVDNSTMMASVEARVPFVDHRLIELVAGTSYEWKTGNSFKEPLKRIFGPIIPNQILDRDKVGFPVPLGIIFENSNNHSLYDRWFDHNLQILNN